MLMVVPCLLTTCLNAGSAETKLRDAVKLKAEDEMMSEAQTLVGVYVKILQCNVSVRILMVTVRNFCSFDKKMNRTGVNPRIDHAFSLVH